MSHPWHRPEQTEVRSRDRVRPTCGQLEEREAAGSLLDLFGWSLPGLDLTPGDLRAIQPSGTQPTAIRVVPESVDGPSPVAVIADSRFGVAQSRTPGAPGTASPVPLVFGDLTADGSPRWLDSVFVRPSNFPAGSPHEEVAAAGARPSITPAGGREMVAPAPAAISLEGVAAPIVLPAARLPGTDPAAGDAAAVPAAPADARPADPAATPPPEPAVERAPDGLPLSFVANLGQWDDEVRFAASDGGIAAQFTDDAIQLRLAGDAPAAVTLAFEGASEAVVVGEAEQSGYYNFFVGNDPARWRSEVPAFGSVLYDGLYQGVDVRVREGGGGFEYDLLLEPGADLSQVVVRADGATGLELAGDGSLVIRTAAGELRQSAPVTWEVLPGGGTRPVEAQFRVLDAEHYGFTAPGRDPGLGLVVDPGLEWATYLGGNRGDEVFGLTATNDGTGDVIIAGYTLSADFPATGGTFSYSTKSYVARFDSSGGLVYSTLFGSPTHYAYVHDVAVDASGAPVVTGVTRAADYPTTPGAYDTTYGGNGSVGDDVFVTRFNAAGTGLVFSTYLGMSPRADDTTGGAGSEEGQQVAVAADGSVVVAGWTSSADFPTTAGAYDRVLSAPLPDNGGHATMDLFVSRFNPTGTALTYSTYLGAQMDERVTGLVVDPQGFVTLSGYVIPEGQVDVNGGFSQTVAPFPTTPDAVQRNHEGNYPTNLDAIVVRLKPDGAGAADLRYSTILGGSVSDSATALALDPNNSELVTVVGYSTSWNFRTTPGVLRRAPISGDDWQMAFVSKFRFPATGGGTLAWSTLLGGPGGQNATDVVVEGTGDAVVVGVGGMDFPTTERSYRRLSHSGDAYVARVSGDGKQIRYATLLGGSDAEGIRNELKVAPGGPNGVVVGGTTLSPDFPTTPGAFDRVLNADGSNQDPILGATRTDAFLAKMDLAPNPTADTAAAAPALLSPADGAAFPAPTFEANTVIVPFDWTDVADPSGVQAYQIEISPDPDFDLNRSNVAEWVVLEPTASQADGHFIHWVGHQGRYFWRVRTLDGVNNWSPWSAVRTVNLGSVNFQRVSHIGADRPEVTGGGTLTGTLVIQDRLAPAGGATFTLASNNPAVARVPASVTVPAGSDRVDFTITTSAVSTSTPVRISTGDTFETEVIWVDPGPAPAAMLSAVTVNPSIVTGGVSAQGTVTLTAAAPAGGLIVSLASSNTTAATVPASVTVPAGATSATFAVTTRAVTASTLVTVTASAGGVSKSATLTVSPAAAATLSGLSLDPTSVRGGTSATGAVTLTGPAPAGGRVVTLVSSNTAVATVPASVTVPAGSTSASFTVSTRAVPANTSVTITASAGGASRSAALTITPPQTDTVSVARAEYKVSDRQLRVEATSTSSSATLRVYSTATGELIGTLRNEGGGRYRGQFAWPVNPQNVTVRSSLGGSASRAVTTG